MWRRHRPKMFDPERSMRRNLNDLEEENYALTKRIKILEEASKKVEKDLEWHGTMFDDIDKRTNAITLIMSECDPAEYKRDLENAKKILQGY